MALKEEVVFPRYLSREVKGLIRGLLEKDPEKRIGRVAGVKEVIEHPWMKRREQEEEDFRNTFFGKQFKEYLEEREPDNSYVENEVGRDDFEPSFPNIYF